VALGAPLAKPGKSRRKIIRCLKRYLASEVYRMLVSCGTRSSPTGTKAEVYIAIRSSTT
jgi:hypothetical protein